jgi:hypothetical protein
MVQNKSKRIVLVIELRQFAAISTSRMNAIHIVPSISSFKLLGYRSSAGGNVPNANGFVIEVAS